jgi:membrane-bound ClpP family serine protease
MSLLAIIILIILGVFLFIVEFLLIPGVTIAGIGGALLMAAAVFFSYKYHGNLTGNITLLSTLAFSILTIIISMRTKTWTRLMLNKNIDSKVEVGLEDEAVKPGDTGESMTRMNPVGKVMVNGLTVEGKSVAGIIDPNTKIKVIKVLGTQVIVKPLNIE